MTRPLLHARSFFCVSRSASSGVRSSFRSSCLQFGRFWNHTCCSLFRSFRSSSLLLLLTAFSSQSFVKRFPCLLRLFAWIHDGLHMLMRRRLVLHLVLLVRIV